MMNAGGFMDNYDKIIDDAEKYDRLYQDEQQLVYERDKLLQQIEALKLFKEDYAVKIKKATDFFEQKQQAIHQLNTLATTVKIFEQFKNQYNHHIKLQDIAYIQSQNQEWLRQVDREIDEKEKRIRRIDYQLDEVNYLIKQLNVYMRNG